MTIHFYIIPKSYDVIFEWSSFGKENPKYFKYISLCVFIKSHPFIKRTKKCLQNIFKERNFVIYFQPQVFFFIFSQEIFVALISTRIFWHFETRNIFDDIFVAYKYFENISWILFCLANEILFQEKSLQILK